MYVWFSLSAGNNAMYNLYVCGSNMSSITNSSRCGHKFIKEQVARVNLSSTKNISEVTIITMCYVNYYVWHFCCMVLWAYLKYSSSGKVRNLFISQEILLWFINSTLQVLVEKRSKASIDRGFHIRIEGVKRDWYSSGSLENGVWFSCSHISKSYCELKLKIRKYYELNDLKYIYIYNLSKNKYGIIKLTLISGFFPLIFQENMLL
jgi:hypothetical protein